MKTLKKHIEIADSIAEMLEDFPGVDPSELISDALAMFRSADGLGEADYDAVTDILHDRGLL